MGLFAAEEGEAAPGMVRGLATHTPSPRSHAEVPKEAPVNSRERDANGGFSLRDDEGQEDFRPRCAAGGRVFEPRATDFRFGAVFALDAW